MSFRGKLCVSLAKKNILEEKQDQGNNQISCTQERNVFADEEDNPGFVEVPLDYFSKKSIELPNFASNSSPSICSDTTDCSNLPDVRMTPSPNIVEEDLSFKSTNILPIPKIFYQEENSLSEISKEDTTYNKNVTLTNEEKQILSVKKKLFVDDNAKSYTYLENVAEFQQSGSVALDEPETNCALTYIDKNVEVCELLGSHYNFTTEFVDQPEIEHIWPLENINNSDHISERLELVGNLDTAQEPVLPEKPIIKKTDRVLHNFGKIVEEESSSNLELIDNHRRWTKKSCCPYCYIEVTHFPRHLQRKHEQEGAVGEILELAKNDPKRKILLDSLRRQGNYILNSQMKKTRPVRRPRTEETEENYFPCNFCLGFFKKQYLRRHRKTCKMNKNSANLRENHLSECQAFYICTGQNKEFFDSLRLKTEVLNKMRVDEISKIVMGDILICSYGESQLKRHKRVQLATMVSNRIREMGRLLIVLKQTTGIRNLFDALKPEFFDNIVTATKIISGYDEEKRNFKSPSLALHMSTRLVQVCDIATKLIIKKSRFIQYGNSEESLKNIKRLRALISCHFNSEISSLALKDLNEKHWEKPKMFPLTSELQKFQHYVMEEANKASEYIKANEQLDVNFRKLTECVMSLTLLINRKRIGEVQFLKLNTYTNTPNYNHAEEFLESLTERENILTKHFKRVVTGGKGSKPVAILFPKKIQFFIDTMLSFRSKCVPNSNEYLFANPKTTNRWLSGYHVLKKLAGLSGVTNKNLFTSTRLRKQIATVLQVMNVSETEMEQFANFMGHTKKTHEEYYRLPQDIFQTAKVSKILIAINKGQGGKYKGKSLDEINLSDIDSDDSEDEFSNNPKHQLKSDKYKNKNDMDDLGPKPVSDTPSSSKTPKIVTRKETSKKMESEDENYLDSSSSSDSQDSRTRAISKKKKTSERQSWSMDQSRVVRKFFATHIVKKIAPKKHEVEELKKKYPMLFKDRNWVGIKAYVYNCYRKT